MAYLYDVVLFLRPSHVDTALGDGADAATRLSVSRAIERDVIRRVEAVRPGLQLQFIWEPAVGERDLVLNRTSDDGNIQLVYRALLDSVAALREVFHEPEAERA